MVAGVLIAIGSLIAISVTAGATTTVANHQTQACLGTPDVVTGGGGYAYSDTNTDTCGSATIAEPRTGRCRRIGRTPPAGTELRSTWEEIAGRSSEPIHPEDA